MTDTTSIAPAADQNSGRGRPNGSLSTMLLPELKKVAHDMGLAGTSSMKKSDLVSAISAAQSGAAQSGGAPAGGAPAVKAGRTRRPRGENGAESAASTAVADVERQGEPRSESGDQRSEGGQRGPETIQDDRPQRESGQRAARQRDGGRDRGQQDRESRDGTRNQPQGRTGREGTQQRESGGDNNPDQAGGQQRESSEDSNQNQDGDQNQGGGQNQNRDNDRYSDEPGGRRRRGRDRNRNRNDRNDRNDRDERRPGNQGNPRNQGNQGRDIEPEVTEDDVLVPVAGILDILDNYAFVRTTGYLPGPTDVYVSLSMVKRYGLRKGDAITGQSASPARAAGSAGRSSTRWSGSTRVNGADPEAARGRVEFGKLTPLYPQQRLRLETDATQPDHPDHRPGRPDRQGPARPHRLAAQGRQDDGAAGDRQRDHHEQPRVPPHGRARRRASRGGHRHAALGQGRGHRLDLRPARRGPHHGRRARDRAGQAPGRARPRRRRPARLDDPPGPRLQPAAPRRPGRILSGGVDSAALYPPKKFFGAARNIENGGSLTILATALVETGSRMDEVIFEEFKGTGNMELKLDRRLADKRIFPAVDVDASGTRKEELLMAPRSSRSCGSCAACCTRSRPRRPSSCC